eukprot:SAG31_NODE_2300_length_5980_cov_17.062744_4_plen_217_part_00
MHPETMQYHQVHHTLSSDTPQPRGSPPGYRANVLRCSQARGVAVKYTPAAMVRLFVLVIAQRAVTSEHKIPPLATYQFAGFVRLPRLLELTLVHHFMPVAVTVAVDVARFVIHTSTHGRPALSIFGASDWVCTLGCFLGFGGDGRTRRREGGGGGPACSSQPAAAQGAARAHCCSRGRPAYRYALVRGVSPSEVAPRTTVDSCPSPPRGIATRAHA